MRNRWRWRLVATAGVVAVAGIAWLQPGGEPGGDAPLRAGPARLIVYQTWVGGALYVEESRSYLSVTAHAGERDRLGYFVTDAGRPVYSRRLAAGTCGLASWQRPCDGNCGFLDPPADRCRRTVTLRPGHLRRLHDRAHTRPRVPDRGRTSRARKGVSPGGRMGVCLYSPRFPHRYDHFAPSAA